MTNTEKRLSLRAGLGVLGVTLAQVLVALGVVWVSRHTTASKVTILIPAMLVLAGFAHFQFINVLPVRSALKIGLAVLATIFSAYWMMFALLNTFGS